MWEFNNEFNLPDLQLFCLLVKINAQAELTQNFTNRLLAQMWLAGNWSIQRGIYRYPRDFEIKTM